MRKGYIVFSMLMWNSIFTPSFADESQNRALEEVRELLPLVCGEFQSSGSSQSLKITGDAEAKLDGLIKRLVALGVKGATEFSSDEYVGVLRTEVGHELKSVRECRLKIYNDMKDLISGRGPAASIRNQGNQNANINGNGNSVSIK